MVASTFHRAKYNISTRQEHPGKDWDAPIDLCFWSVPIQHVSVGINEFLN